MKLTATANDWTMDYGVHLGFQPYLQSNDLPGREVLEEASSSKVHLLADLHILEEEIRALEKRRNSLKERLATFDYILAPVRHLPDDVLVEVFCHTIPTKRNARPFISESPLLLTLVCKKWRTLAMSAPRLWTTLHIPLVFRYDPRPLWTARTRRIVYYEDFNVHQSTNPLQHVLSKLYAARDAGLDQWLRRSAPLSISISLAVTAPHRPPTPDPTEHLQQAVIDLIARYADRLSAFEAVVPQDILHRLGRAITERSDCKDLPRLHHLRLSCGQRALALDEMLSYAPAILSPWTTAESLQELSLRVPSGYDINHILTSLSVNITTLSVHEVINVPRAWSTLLQLRGLERCNLNVVDDTGRRGLLSLAPPPPKLTRAPIMLRALDTLSINGTLPDIQTLCQPLETPSLSTLQLQIRSTTGLAPPPPMGSKAPSDIPNNDVILPYPPDSTQQLCAFLTQCTSLHSLAIVPSFIEAAELQSILSAVPQIKSLVLNGTQTACVGSEVRISSNPLPFLVSRLEYSLDPLLRQQRVLSSSGDSHTRLDTPLLPFLESFEWHQFSERIPIDHFVTFVNKRLFQSVARLSAGGRDIATSKSAVPEFNTPQQAPIASLKKVKIRVRSASAVGDIESRVIQHAETEDLKRGVDFHLDIALCGSVVPAISDGPRYVIPRGFSRPDFVNISDDNLIIEPDVTWQWIEF